MRTPLDANRGLVAKSFGDQVLHEIPAGSVHAQVAESPAPEIEDDLSRSQLLLPLQALKVSGSKEFVHRSSRASLRQGQSISTCTSITKYTGRPPKGWTRICGSS